MAHKADDEKGSLEKPNEDFNDPRTGLYLTTTGVLRGRCPACGLENIAYVDPPTLLYRFRCAACENEFEIDTRTPASGGPA